MRYVVASLFVICCSIPCAFGALPTLDQIEQSCESASGPMGACIRQQLWTEYAAEGIPEAEVEQTFNGTPFGAYFHWLDEHAQRIPASGPQRTRILRRVRAKTSEVRNQAVQLFAEQCSAMLPTAAQQAFSLQQQLAQAQAKIAQLEHAQADQQAKDARVERAIELLKLMNAATAVPSATMPAVTCNSRPMGDGSTSVSCY